MLLPPPDRRHAWIAWIGFFAFLCVLILANPGRHSVTDAYFPVAKTWWVAEHDIYTPGYHGFLYMPQSVLLFTPFAWLPSPWNDLVWRLLGLALLAFGLERVAALSDREGRGGLFAWASVLTFATVVSSARNGQTNLHLAGLMLHAGADLAGRRWTRASVLLWLGMLTKPVAIVPILLAGALYRPMAGRLLIGAVAFAALPFLHLDWSYVARQYGLMIGKLTRSMQPEDRVQADLLWGLHALGVHTSWGLRLGIRALAAGATLLLCWIARRRGGPLQGAFLLTAFAACYLVLFNPRSETNSYVLLIPFPALLAALAWRWERRPYVAVFLVLLCVAFGSDNYGRTLHGAVGPWLKPMAGLAFLLLLGLRLRTLPLRPLLPDATAAAAAE